MASQSLEECEAQFSHSAALISDLEALLESCRHVTVGSPAARANDHEATPSEASRAQPTPDPTAPFAAAPDPRSAYGTASGADQELYGRLASRAGGVRRSGGLRTPSRNSGALEPVRGPSRVSLEHPPAPRTHNSLDSVYLGSKEEEPEARQGGGGPPLPSHVQQLLAPPPSAVGRRRRSSISFLPASPSYSRASMELQRSAGGGDEQTFEVGGLATLHRTAMTP
jgi:hypothetical protein